MAKYKIGIGFTSVDSKVHWVTLVSALQAMSGRDWSDYEIKVYPASSIYVGMNRCNIGSCFLKDDGDYLLYLDYDNGFYPDALPLFMEDMARPDVHIVSGAYYWKGSKRHAGQLVAGYRFPQTHPMGYDFFPASQLLKDGLYNCSKFIGQSIAGIAGGGCLMLKREVLEKVEYPWFWESLIDGVFMGEDTIFCMKAEKAGYDIWLDTRIKSPHMSGIKCYPPEWRQYNDCSSIAENLA